MPKEKQKFQLKYVLAFLLAILIILGTLVPLPYYLEVPGTAEKLTNVVTVDGESDEQKGAFMLTTVGIRQATGVQMLMGHFMDFTDIYSKDELFGQSTSEEYNDMQKYYMDSSENNATKVALDLAQIPYEMVFKGIYVLAVQETSDFYGKLKVGDTVTCVDGQTFQTSEEFMTYVKSKNVGDSLSVTYEREGETGETTGKLIELETDHKAGIGIQLTDRTDLQTQKDIKIDAGDIGGPSAGLMFTLETYSLLAQKDIRHGNLIAGTGTMSYDGTVGRIGGIDKKIVAANKAGATIFFAPDDDLPKEVLEANPGIKSNYQEALAAAKKINSKMTIVPVKTVQDALDYLATLE